MPLCAHHTSGMHEESSRGSKQLPLCVWELVGGWEKLILDSNRIFMFPSVILWGHFLWIHITMKETVMQILVNLKSWFCADLCKSRVVVLCRSIKTQFVMFNQLFRLLLNCVSVNIANLCTQITSQGTQYQKIACVDGLVIIGKHQNSRKNKCS